jgi:hypothetical protein
MAGRPAFKPTETERETVQAMAAYGIPQDRMVLVIRRPRGRGRVLHPISENTLRKHFRDELDTGEVMANSKVAETLYKTAVDRKHRGHVAAAIFWLKSRAGWSERTIHTHEGQIDFDFSDATPEELVVLERLLKRKIEDGRPVAANAA